MQILPDTVKSDLTAIKDENIFKKYAEITEQLYY